jgi:hypothetical protein
VDDDPPPDWPEPALFPKSLCEEPPLPLGDPLPELVLVAELLLGGGFFGFGFGLGLSPGIVAGEPSDVMEIWRAPLAAAVGASCPAAAGGADCFLVMAPSAKARANTITTPAAIAASVRGPMRRLAPSRICAAPIGVRPSPGVVAPCTSSPSVPACAPPSYAAVRRLNRTPERAFTTGNL